MRFQYNFPQSLIPLQPTLPRHALPMDTPGIWQKASQLVFSYSSVALVEIINVNNNNPAPAINPQVWAESRDGLACYLADSQTTQYWILHSKSELTTVCCLPIYQWKRMSTCPIASMLHYIVKYYLTWRLNVLGGLAARLGLVDGASLLSQRGLLCEVGQHRSALQANDVTYNLRGFRASPQALQDQLLE